MTDVPYKRFVVVHDQLHLASNDESHLQLAYTASASLPPEETLSALNGRIEGWLTGKGKDRRAVIRSTQAPNAVTRVHEALRKAGMGNVQVVQESDADVRFPG